MKRISALATAPPGLSEYRDQERCAATWEGFGSHRGSTDAKRQLAEALAGIQHGLCGYCEIRLHPRDRVIEHVIPRSDLARGGSERELDHTNMIASCRGGASEPHHPDIRADAARFRRPPRMHQSCDHAKGDTSDPSFLDPRTIPALPSLFRVLVDGEIAADAVACRSEGVDPARVARTIEILGLNVPRLREARAARRRDLEQDWTVYDGDPGKIRAAARRELLPDEDGRLAGFFTTARSFFGTVGEAILGAADEVWV